MIVPIPNALTTNVVGVGSSPFPAAFSFAVNGEVEVVRLCPMQLQHVTDIISAHCSEYLFVFGVDRIDFEDGADGSWTVRPIAAVLEEVGVTAIRNDGGELVIGRGDLTPLFANVSHNRATILDLDDAAADIFTAWCNVTGGDRADGRPVLSDLAIGNTICDVHDDCYVRVETRRRGTIAHALLARLLAMLAGTATHQAGQSPEVIEPGPETTSAVLGDNGLFLADQAGLAVGAHEVVIPFSRSTWRLGQRPPPPTAWLVYDIAGRTWTLTPVS